MGDSWTCVSRIKGPGILDDEIILLMKLAACMLEKYDRQRMNFGDADYDGIIETDGQSVSLGGIAGTLFRVDIETSKDGRYQVNFLLNRRDLKRGAKLLADDAYDEEDQGPWHTVRHHLPRGEGPMSDFRDLRRPRLN